MKGGAGAGSQSPVRRGEGERGEFRQLRFFASLLLFLPSNVMAQPSL